VKQGDLLFEIDPSTFQAKVNLARAERDNMRDIVKSLTEQVDVMRAGVAQSESDRNQARFEVEGYAANTENARVELERTKILLDQGVTDQRDYDNKNATYQEDLAQLNGAKSHVNQMTADLERSKAGLARSMADLGVLGDANPRLRRAEADLKIAEEDLNFTKVWAPVDGYITNLQLRVGDSAVANQPIVAVIDANSFYIEAFFRETFIGNFQNGDRAVVTLMSYPSSPLEASVESIGWGIAQQNGSAGYELLPSVKPTFEWIRLAQRIPVIVRIEKLPDDIKLRAGTTASVVVITGTGTNADRVPPAPRPLQ